MKVGLINPGFKYTADKMNLDFHNLPGIAYIGASLKSKGYDVVNVDFMHDENASLDQVRDCDIVGVATYLNSYNFLRETLPKLEKKGQIIIAGGPLISSYGRSSSNTLMNLCPEITAGVIGEGENTVVDIVDYIASRRFSFPEAGIIFRSHGKLEASELPGSAVKNLDDVAEINYNDWQGFVKSSKGETVDVAMSRGCYNNCTYCFHMNKGVRSFGLSRIERELSKVAALKPRFVTFSDDVFAYDHARAVRIGKILQGYGLKYAIETRANDLTHELARDLAKTGCAQIKFGIESFDQGILDRAHKNVKVEDIYGAIKTTQDAGMIATGFFLFGLPGESRKTIETTFRKIEETKVLPRARVLIPLPGTQIYRDLVSQGRINEVEMLKNFAEPAHNDTASGNWVPINLTEDVSDSELIEARDRAIFLRDKFEGELAR